MHMSEKSPFGGTGSICFRIATESRANRTVTGRWRVEPAAAASVKGRLEKFGRVAQPPWTRPARLGAQRASRAILGRHSPSEIARIGAALREQLGRDLLRRETCARPQDRRSRRFATAHAGMRALMTARQDLQAGRALRAPRACAAGCRQITRIGAGGVGGADAIRSVEMAVTGR
jgi:hypothetical protein